MKICEVGRTDWQDKLNAALWAYQTTLKDSTRHTPFKLVYGLEAIVPAEYTVPSLRIVVYERLGDVESNFSRLVTLEKLSESKQLALHALGAEKLRRKAWHDRNLRDKKLADGDLVLLYISKSIKAT